jgi:TRAP-type C4-dicarboxylate transport system substrate-binding protein
MLSAKFYETAKHFTLTRHIHTPVGAFVSDRTLQKLPANLRDGLLQAIQETAKDQFIRAAQVEEEAISQLKQKGVTVSDCDREGFRTRMQPLWDKFAQQTPGAKALLEAVRQTEKA